MSEVSVVESAESGGEVTFVGGKAVEQTTAGETPDGDHGDELAAAKAAVKKALAEEAAEAGKSAAKEAKAAREKDPLVPRDRGPDGKFLPTAGDDSDDAEPEAPKAKAKAPAEPDESASALRKALAERRETARFKEEAKAELAKMQAETRQFYAQLQREKAQVEAEKAKMALFRKDPVRAIRENGWTNPEEFILDIAQDGTPEGQARRQQRELQQQLQELQEWKAAQARQIEEQKAAHAEAQKKAFRQNVEREFLKEAFSDKNKHLSTLYKGHEVGLIAEADVVAEQYRNATGKDCSLAEIAEYLEERTAKWYKSMTGAQGAPSVTQGTPTQGKPTGRSIGSGKSLSPAGSSERRTLGNSLKDLDGDERLEAARTAVRSAIQASGDR